MRFLYKRPRMEDVQEELNTLMDLMVSKTFVIIDLFWCCLIFTLLLSPVLPTVTMSILFFCGSYVFFNVLYYLFFYPYIKKIKLSVITFYENAGESLLLQQYRACLLVGYVWSSLVYL